MSNAVSWSDLPSKISLHRPRSAAGIELLWNSLIGRMISLAEALRLRQTENEWTLGLWCLAARSLHQVTSEPAILERLIGWFEPLLDESGNWLSVPTEAPMAMKGCGLLYLAEVTKEERWRMAARGLLDDILLNARRGSDGCLTYSNSTEYVLVDTLGIVCPFLIDAGISFQNDIAVNLGLNQIISFAEKRDPQTRLPYHGYCPGGCLRLGLQGWGRGVGWYAIGLADSYAVLPTAHAGRAIIAHLVEELVEDLGRYQRADGHWSWYLPHDRARADTSATAFIGYALARATKLGIGGNPAVLMADRARSALVATRHPNGSFGGASGECGDIGRYSFDFQAYSWSQSLAVATLVLTQAHS